MANSMIYAGNNATQATVATGTTITFPNIVRRYGNNLNVSGGNIVAKGTGYFNGTLNLTFEGTAAGTLAITIYNNGTAIPYADASITTVADNIYAVAIPFTIRNTCNCVASTISVVLSGVVVDVTNAGLVVTKE